MVFQLQIILTLWKKFWRIILFAKLTLALFTKLPNIVLYFFERIILFAKLTLILFQVGQASCIPFCPNLVPCIHLPRQILSIDRHHFQWNTDTEVRYEIILVCKWKYRILRSFGNEIKLAGITTRWLRGPILEQRLVALMKRMLHFNKSTLVDYTMRKGLFCVNFIQRMLRLFLRFSLVCG